MPILPYNLHPYLVKTSNGKKLWQTPEFRPWKLIKSYLYYLPCPCKKKKCFEIGFSKIVVQTYAMLQKGDQTTLKIAVCDFKPTL